MSALRRRVIVAFVSFIAAAVAAWFTASPPAAGPAQSIPGILSPDKSAAATDEAADTSPAGALAAAERAFAAEFAAHDEHFTGEKLVELCLAHGVDDPSASYARLWAKKSPRDMYDWMQRRGSLEFFNNVPRGGYLNLVTILFTEWAGQDAGAAMQAALTCSDRANRGLAVRAVVSAVQRTDPARAVALLAEHMEFCHGGWDWDQPLSAKDADYRATWAAITKLPAGSSRNTLLGFYFDELWQNRRKENVRIWQELPEELRADLVAGSFKGISAMLMGVPVPQPIPQLEGMDEMRRRHVETTGDTDAAAHFVASRSGREWAERDPAAAVAWAQQYLKGEARVKATARLFRPAAEGNFDAALKVLETLPPGMLRVRAIGNLAAGAPPEHAAEVKALLATLQGDDRRLADIIRSREESDAQIQRLKDMQEARRHQDEQ
jgi:hypothetical protein